jgi:16S rRNA (cytosine967-C5)-methyltransferase
LSGGGSVASVKIGGSTVRGLALQLLLPYEQKVGIDTLLPKADESLSKALLSLAQPSDKALLTQLVYGTLRHWGQLGQAIEQLNVPHKLKALQPKVRLVLRVGLYQLLWLEGIAPYAVLNETLNASKKALKLPPAPVKLINALLRKASQLADTQGQEAVRFALQKPLSPSLNPQTPEAVAYQAGWPLWWIEAMGVSNYQQAQSLIEASRVNAPTVIRVNQLKGSTVAYCQTLVKAGIEYQQPWAETLPQLLLLPSWRGNPAGLPLFEEGWVYVQDMGSAWLATQLPIKPTQTVVDLCAAPGSKTMVLADTMNNQGALWAVDRSAKRLDRLTANAKRLGVNTETFLKIVAQEGESFTLPKRQKANAVLVDAPCSGSGTLRRHPEILLRLKPEQLPSYQSQQLALLQQAVTLLAPQGWLLYSTCSLFQAENEQVVERLMLHDPSLRLVQQETLYPTVLNDGFYMALLQK